MVCSYCTHSRKTVCARAFACACVYECACAISQICLNSIILPPILPSTSHGLEGKVPDRSHYHTWNFLFFHRKNCIFSIKIIFPQNRMKFPYKKFCMLKWFTESFCCIFSISKFLVYMVPWIYICLEKNIPLSTWSSARLIPKAYWFTLIQSYKASKIICNILWEMVYLKL